MKSNKRISVIIVLLLMGSLAGYAQDKEYKKLIKSGPTTESLENFIMQFPDFAPAYLKLGDAYDKKDPEKALKYYEEALNMMSDEETQQHEKYYEDYKQRDLRTGKFIVKTRYLEEYINEKIQENKEG